MYVFQTVLSSITINSTAFRIANCVGKVAMIKFLTDGVFLHLLLLTQQAALVS